MFIVGEVMACPNRRASVYFECIGCGCNAEFEGLFFGEIPISAHLLRGVET